MKISTRILLGASAVLLSAQALAQVTFYEGEDFHGRAFTTNRQQPDFSRYGFNNRASSAIVDSGRWEVCEDPGFEGRCVVLREGSYDSLKRMGVNNRISSVRRIGRDYRRDDRDRDRADYYEPEPLPQATYEYRRRPNERVYEADVTSVRAVMGRPEQRCWIERERVDRGGGGVAGGIVGGVIGGILGHQIGRGTGRDVATVGGAAAGAAIGANAGKQGYDRDVRHCETAQSGPPDYWDVSYRFRNVEHHIQMTQPPGDTILVNRQGEPRQ
jgi:uncharacterized protein YcfJ